MTAPSPTPAYGDPTEVVGRRIFAYGLDLLLMGLLTALAFVPLIQSTVVTASSAEVRCPDTSFDPVDDQGFRPEVASDLCIEAGDNVYYVPAGDEDGFSSQLYLIGFAVQVLNLVILQGLVGASVGKLAVGLRVIREDGTRAGVGWALLRWVVLFIDSACCFLPGAALVFTTKGHRRLGDMLASTFVVRTASVGTPPQVPGVTSVEVAPQQLGGWGAPMTSGQPWGPPGAPPGTWAPPPSSPPVHPPVPTTPATTTPEAPAADGPIWDDARDTYIQYDRSISEWVQWDPDTSQWRPIDQ